MKERKEEKKKIRKQGSREGRMRERKEGKEKIRKQKEVEREGWNEGRKEENKKAINYRGKVGGRKGEIRKQGN